MKRSLNSTDEPETAAWPNDPMVLGLRQALQGFRKKNQELLAENLALKNGLANNEPYWEQEKKKLLYEKDSLASALSIARKDLNRLAEDLESVRAVHRKCETECNELDKRVKEKENEVQSLRKSLHLQTNETKTVRKLWKAEQDQASQVMLSIEKTLLESNAKWKEWWFARQQEVATELQTLQAHYEKKVSDITKEKNDAVTSVITEAVAMLQENMTIFAGIKTEIQQREAEWENKNRSLEDCLRSELAVKENIFQQIEELQKQTKDNEDKWLAKEEERINKENEMKEEMKLLLQKNAELQELALKTDKEKAKMRELEKKEKKESEKRFKEEGGRKEKRRLTTFLFS